MNDYTPATVDAINLGPEERALLVGDLKALNEPQRAKLYVDVCASVGLNPLTRPFEYIVLNSKLTLYARKDATEQLRKNHRISLKIVARENLADVYVVTAQAMTASGRFDESIGAVPIAGLKGEPLANAIMKAETKAKRRVTLSICGLGMLDETELETIPTQSLQHTHGTPEAGHAAQRALAAPASAQATVLVSPALVAQIRGLADQLGFDAARLAKGVSVMSEGTTEDVEHLLPAQGAKLHSYLQRELAKKPAAPAAPCDACGATSGTEHLYSNRGEPCPNDTTPAAEAKRQYFAAAQAAEAVPPLDEVPF